MIFDRFLDISLYLDTVSGHSRTNFVANFALEFNNF